MYNGISYLQDEICTQVINNLGAEFTNNCNKDPLPQECQCQDIGKLILVARQYLSHVTATNVTNQRQRDFIYTDAAYIPCPLHFKDVDTLHPLLLPSHPQLLPTSLLQFLLFPCGFPKFKSPQPSGGWSGHIHTGLSRKLHVKLNIMSTLPAELSSFRQW